MRYGPIRISRVVLLAVNGPGGQDKATVRRIIADLDAHVRNLLVGLVSDTDLPPSALSELE